MQISCSKYIHGGSIKLLICLTKFYDTTGRMTHPLRLQAASTADVATSNGHEVDYG